MLNDKTNEFINYLGQKEYKNLTVQIAKHMGISLNENEMPPASVLNSVKEFIELLFSEQIDKEKEISVYVDKLPHNSDVFTFALKEYLWSINQRIINLNRMSTNGVQLFNKAIVILCCIPFLSLCYVFLFGNEWTTQILNNYINSFFYNRLIYMDTLMGAACCLVIFCICKCIDYFSVKHLKKIISIIWTKYISRLVICLICLFFLLLFFNDLFFSESTANKLLSVENTIKDYVSAEELNQLKISNQSYIKRLSQGNPDFIYTILAGLLCFASLFIMEIVNGWRFVLNKVNLKNKSTKKINLQDDTEFLWKLSVFLGEEGITERTKEIAEMFNSIIQLPEFIAKERINSEVDRLAKCSDSYKYEFLLLLLNYVSKNSSNTASQFGGQSYSEIKKSKKNFSECLLSFFKGEYGLAFSFWLVLLPYFVISNFIYTKFSPQITYHMLLKDAWFICSMIIDILFRLYFYVSVWNAATKYKKNVLYNYLAKLCIIVLIIIFIAFNYYALSLIFP